MCMKSSEMETDQKKPEVQLAQLLVQHLARHLRVPVIECGEDHEENGANQHVVEVSDDEVAVV